jgi:hypothetical protein
MSKLAVSPVEVPSAVDWRSGLCGTCIHRDTCALRSRNTAPVVFCEEFTPVEPGAQSFSAGFGPRLRPVPAPSTDRASEWIGLCKSCANRHHCTLRKPFGGVWHCEEFA